MQEAHWYYMDRRGQRQGPVAAADAIAAYRSGDLLREGLVWHEGMPQWSPLAQVENELELGPSDHAAVPPLLPDVPRGMPAAAQLRDIDRSDIVYAGFGRRFAALFVDGLILAVPGFILGALLGIPFAMLVKDADPRTRGLAQLVFGMLVGLALRAVYFAVMESSKDQGTIGKRAFGIKVTNEAGERLTFKQALGRWFAAALSHLTLYVGFMMAGFTDRKRALHDMVAGTLVVDRWAYTEFPERQQRGQAGCVIAVIVGCFLAVAVAGILAAIAIPAYQDYMIRSQVSEGAALAEDSKRAVAEYYSNNRRYPANNEAAGVRASTSISDNYVSSVTIANGTITVAYGGPRANVRLPANATLVFSPLAVASSITWSCNSAAGTTLDVKYRPTICRP